jgi:hypothetical protein
MQKHSGNGTMAQSDIGDYRPMAGDLDATIFPNSTERSDAVTPGENSLHDVMHIVNAEEWEATSF